MSKKKDLTRNKLKLAIAFSDNPVIRELAKKMYITEFEEFPEFETTDFKDFINERKIESKFELE